MRKMQIKTFISSLMVIFFFFSVPLLGWGGDIYFYRDKHGVFHFTDLPDSPKYRLFLPYYSLLDREKIKRLVKKYCKIYGVEYPLALSILEVESGYDPTATSSRGAQGLMQIMPSTQRDLQIYSPYDPENNIEGGIRYFSRLLKKYKNIKLAIAAYNAGPGAVDKYGGIPPYRETRKYVKKVLKRYREIKKEIMVSK